MDHHRSSPSISSHHSSDDDEEWPAAEIAVIAAPPAVTAAAAPLVATVTTTATIAAPSVSVPLVSPVLSSSLSSLSITDGVASPSSSSINNSGHISDGDDSDGVLVSVATSPPASPSLTAQQQPSSIASVPSVVSIPVAAVLSSLSSSSLLSSSVPDVAPLVASSSSSSLPSTVIESKMVASSPTSSDHRSSDIPSYLRYLCVTSRIDANGVTRWTGPSVDSMADQRAKLGCDMIEAYSIGVRFEVDYMERIMITTSSAVHTIIHPNHRQVAAAAVKPPVVTYDAATDSLVSSTNLLSGSVAIDVIVRKIKMMRKSKRDGFEFLVGWRGFTDEQDTWEPEETLAIDYQSMIDEFRATMREVPQHIIAASSAPSVLSSSRVVPLSGSSMSSSSVLSSMKPSLSSSGSSLSSDISTMATMGDKNLPLVDDAIDATAEFGVVASIADAADNDNDDSDYDTKDTTTETEEDDEATARYVRQTSDDEQLARELAAQERSQPSLIDSKRSVNTPLSSSIPSAGDRMIHASSYQSGRDATATKACYRLKEYGHCFMGDQCLFSHAGVTNVAPSSRVGLRTPDAPLAPQSVAEEEDDNDDDNNNDATATESSSSWSQEVLDAQAKLNSWLAASPQLAAAVATQNEDLLFSSHPQSSVHKIIESITPAPSTPATSSSVVATSSSDNKYSSYITIDSITSLLISFHHIATEMDRDAIISGAIGWTHDGDAITLLRSSATANVNQLIATRCGYASLSVLLNQLTQLRFTIIQMDEPVDDNDNERDDTDAIRVVIRAPWFTSGATPADLRRLATVIYNMGPGEPLLDDEVAAAATTSVTPVAAATLAAVAVDMTNAWQCGHCKYTNYASKHVCYRCATAKPAVSQTSTATVAAAVPVATIAAPIPAIAPLSRSPVAVTAAVTPVPSLSSTPVVSASAPVVVVETKAAPTMADGIARAKQAVDTLRASLPIQYRSLSSVTAVSLAIQLCHDRIAAIKRLKTEHSLGGHFSDDDSDNDDSNDKDGDDTNDEMFNEPKNHVKMLIAYRDALGKWLQLSGASSTSASSSSSSSSSSVPRSSAAAVMGTDAAAALLVPDTDDFSDERAMNAMQHSIDERDNLRQKWAHDDATWLLQSQTYSAATAVATTVVAAAWICRPCGMLNVAEGVVCVKCDKRRHTGGADATREHKSSSSVGAETKTSGGSSSSRSTASYPPYSVASQPLPPVDPSLGNGWQCTTCTYFVPASAGVAYENCPMCRTPRANIWTCDTCTMINTNRRTCEACDTVKPEVDAIKVMRRPIDGKWECPRCSVVNSAHAKGCNSCRLRAEEIRLDALPGGIIIIPVGDEHKGNGIDEWTCRACTTINPSSRDDCSTCNWRLGTNNNTITTNVVQAMQYSSSLSSLPLSSSMINGGGEWVCRDRCGVLNDSSVARCVCDAPPGSCRHDTSLRCPACLPALPSATAAIVPSYATRRDLAQPVDRESESAQRFARNTAPLLGHISLKAIVCPRINENGTCILGDACLYGHDMTDINVQRSVAQQQSRRAARRTASAVQRRLATIDEPVASLVTPEAAAAAVVPLRTTVGFNVSATAVSSSSSSSSAVVPETKRDPATATKFSLEEVDAATTAEFARQHAADQGLRLIADSRRICTADASSAPTMASSSSSSSSSSSTSTTGGGKGGGQQWACSVCTYVNHMIDTSCVICGTTDRSHGVK